MSEAEVKSEVPFAIMELDVYQWLYRDAGVSSQICSSARPQAFAISTSLQNTIG